MPQLLASILDQVRPTTLLDIGLTALLIYWLFSLIRGTRAVRLVIGISVLFVVYFAAQALALRLLTQILQAGAVVGLFALVVIFQPEMRRALERIGRVGSFAWLFSNENREAEQVASQVARAAAVLSADGHGALIVLERDTGLEEIAETGIMIHGDLSVELLRTIFMPRSALHDGAVIVRGGTILAAGALLPLAETTVQVERLGTRHRAALGMTEQTDAVVVVISEENGQVSLVERARIVRNLNELQLGRAIRALLHPQTERGRLRLRPADDGGPGRSPARGLRRLVRRSAALEAAREAAPPLAATTPPGTAGSSPAGTAGSSDAGPGTPAAAPALPAAPPAETAGSAASRR
ncbi:MAG: TIGR00159 family protein [Chloroflexi bacterium]|nr:TIGR00159 family protein [Chloroflexota bacterium]